ncbi:DNA damage-regulated autophagy modulator protein 1-like isoform X1 [Mytilus californianus]|uniref:DNA damage-regulated autophagy modulator protein 1-like isoform X1 n=1 Tax=Mytilus californianus TaxID=6549 RepID=UPI0022473F72|nr:DNA damage-regulated autophagy modulator protein 1-like isoform X1 [Mytilus californianus]XP_052065836.1 DNA damage-regulated autophagy modulator protein 1-like isoform X1 [Mytilus californianus]
MFFAASWCLGRWIWILPIVTNVWIWFSFATTYGLAVAQNHTFPDFPYISYTGVEEPESGIFTFCVAVSAIMLAANAEMRFLFIREKMTRNRANFSKHWQRANTAGLVLAILSSLGLLLVACFQVDTMKPPHYTGAFLCFTLAVGYLWLQTAFTFKLQRARWEFVWQIINSIATCIIFLLFSFSKTYYKMQRKAHPEYTKWDKLRGVFLLSTITEWLLALSIMAFVITFVSCFRELRVITIDVQLKEDHNRYRDQENGQLQESLTDPSNA